LKRIIPILSLYLLGSGFAAPVLRGDHVVAHNERGMNLYKNGDLNAAIAEYRVALSMNPNYAQAHDNPGVALDRSAH
jgi:Flp pilus assembly protein TadD